MILNLGGQVAPNYPLTIIDLNTKKSTDFIDFTDFFEKTNYPELGDVFECEINEVVIFPNSLALVSIGIEKTAEGFGGYRYFRVNQGVITEKLIDTNHDDKSYLWIELKFRFIDNSKELVRATKTFNTGYVPDNINIDLLYKNNLDMVGEVLLMEQNEILGINSHKKKIEFYFLKTRLNTNIQVIIPYKFIPELDIAMYKAYNNTGLTKEDVRGFNKYEFGILRNLIFAKHNYDFSSEFYQAYFNLYAFYNAPDMRNSRTKDVNGKLTETDKQNLELIKGLEN